MAVHSSVGLAVTAGDLSTFEVRVVTKHKTADNKAYVSSKTEGKTKRVAGNEDATWDISLYSKTNITEVPTDLQPGKTIALKLTNDAQSYNMIVDSSDLEVDIEAGELVGIALTCSAVDGDSYPA